MAKLDQRARASGVSRNRYIRRALELAIERESSWSPRFLEMLGEAAKDGDAGARLQRLQRRFAAVLVEMSRAEWTDDVSRAFGEIKAALEARGQRIEDFDVAVAAHAKALDAVLVTDNVSQMARVQGLRVENWSA